MKELYLTWDTERKFGEDNLIMLVEQDTDKVNILFSTNQEIGIKNITDLINQKEPTQYCASVKKTLTNFDRITESTEALAEFITKVVNKCSFNECDECMLADVCCTDKHKMKEWFEKESE